MLGYPDPRGVVHAKAKGTVASGTAAILFVNAANNAHPAIYTITFSYAVNPTNGNISVVHNSVTLLDVDIADTAVYHWMFPEGLYEPSGGGNKMTVTLADGSQNKELNITGRGSSIT